MKKYIILGSIILAMLFPVASFAQEDIDPSPNTSGCVSISNNLRYQSRDVSTNGEVSTLQDFLQSKGYLNSEPTGYFGLLTQKAVTGFQSANGISPTGYVGPITRAKISFMSGCGSDPDFYPTPSVTYPTPTPIYQTPTPIGKYPPGCWSNQGYSPTTGKPCWTDYPTPSVIYPTPTPTPTPVSGTYDTLAKCLKEKGATLYGASWSPYSESVRKLFGYSKYLPYVECSTANTYTQTQICIDKKITGYPTWIFNDGSQLSGFAPESHLQELSRRTSCPLPKPSSVLSVTTPSPLPNAKVGTYYVKHIEVTGNDNNYVWSVLSGSLPPGVVLNPSSCATFPCGASGILSGSPEVAGTYNFTLKIVSASTYATKKFTLTVDSASSSLIFLSPQEGDKWIVGDTERIKWQPYGFSADPYVYLNGGGHQEGYSKFIGNPTVGSNGLNNYLDYTVTSADLPSAPGYAWMVSVCNGPMASGGNNCTWSGQVFVVAKEVPQVSTTLITGKTLGTLRNNFGNWIGMKFTVGSGSIVVKSLGRMMAPGNSGTHTVKLVQASNGADVSGGSVSINMSGGTAGQFKYANLASTVTLSANTSYYLVSWEDGGGDQWYDMDTTVNTISAASVEGPVYVNFGQYNFSALSGHTYIPLDFKY